MGKWLKRIAMFVFIIGLLIGCGADDNNNTAHNDTNTNEETASNEQNEETVQITVSIEKDSEYIDEIDADIEEGDVLMDVLKQNFEIEEEDGFINAVQGVEPEDEEEAWMIYQNGETAEKGAEELELSPGDEIQLDLEEY